jgi:hypothetical protein
MKIELLNGKKGRKKIIMTEEEKKQKHYPL